jgi:hypothetical protein
MNKKSNTNVPIVGTDSRTKTKQNDTKTHFTFGATLGLVLLSRDMRQLFIILQIDQMKQTRVGIVATISLALEERRHLFRVLQSLLPRSKIGIFGLGICRKCTSLENATTQRNFSGRITSGNI